MAGFCLVTQRLGVYLEDGPDADQLPDLYQIKGKVTFSPNINPGDSFKVTDATGVVTVPAVPITADIVDGQIFHNGQPGISLFAAGPKSNPSTVTYTAKYSNLWAGSSRDGFWTGETQLKLRDFTFAVTPGGTVDLGTVTPVAGTPGMGTTEGKKGDPGEVSLAQLNAAILNRGSVTWNYWGVGTPNLTDFPNVKVGDRILRVSDGQVWKVDE